MSYTLRFLPEVEEDALRAYEWYEGKAKGLGEEFLRVFYASAYELQRNPQIYRIVYKNFRRCLTERFPYAIYYMVIEDQVIIYGLFHCARDPKFIKLEISDRKIDT